MDRQEKLKICNRCGGEVMERQSLYLANGLTLWWILRSR